MTALNLDFQFLFSGKFERGVIIFSCTPVSLIEPKSTQRRVSGVGWGARWKRDILVRRSRVRIPLSLCIDKPIQKWSWLFLFPLLGKPRPCFSSFSFAFIFLKEIMDVSKGYSTSWSLKFFPLSWKTFWINILDNLIRSFESKFSLINFPSRSFSNSSMIAWGSTGLC